MHTNKRKKTRISKLAIGVLAALFTLFSAADVIAVAGITVTTRPDLARGGRHFDIQTHDMELPANDNYLAIYLSKDGFYYYLDPYGTALEIPCNPDDTPSCSFFMPGAIATGEYDLEIYINRIDMTFFATATATVEIHPWWEDFTVMKAETDPFTGMTDLSVRFNSVPVEVGAITFDAMADSDGDEYPDTLAMRLSSREESPGIFMCATESQKLPPLCVIDEFGGSYCEYGTHTYFFAVNGIYIYFQLDGVLHRMTRLEEGQYFARQHFESGYLLQDYLDLDTYIHGDETACYYSNYAPCFDIGYYSNWIALYSRDLESLMNREGVFDAKSKGNDITVRAHVPRLPQGAHGFRAAVAYYPADNSDAAVEVALDCDGVSSAEKTIRDLSPGTYQLELRVYNNHPEVIIVDYETNDGYVFGNYLFKTISHPDVIEIKAPALPQNPRWHHWWDGWRSEAYRRLIGRAPKRVKGYLELRRERGRYR